jgi:hypothetical protein
LAEWDEDQTEMSAWVSGAELTEPYALLLTEGLFEAAEAEARAIAAGGQAPAPIKNRARSAADERSAGPVSIYEQMAEVESRRLNSDPAAWQRIRELHAKRFGSQ